MCFVVFSLMLIIYSMKVLREIYMYSCRLKASSVKLTLTLCSSADGKKRWQSGRRPIVKCDCLNHNDAKLNSNSCSFICKGPHNETDFLNRQDVNVFGKASNSEKQVCVVSICFQRLLANGMDVLESSNQCHGQVRICCQFSVS